MQWLSWRKESSISQTNVTILKHSFVPFRSINFFMKTSVPCGTCFVFFPRNIFTDENVKLLGVVLSEEPSVCGKGRITFAQKTSSFWRPGRETYDGRHCECGFPLTFKQNRDCVCFTAPSNKGAVPASRPRGHRHPCPSLGGVGGPVLSTTAEWLREAVLFYGLKNEQQGPWGDFLQWFATNTSTVRASRPCLHQLRNSDCHCLAFCLLHHLVLWGRLLLSTTMVAGWFTKRPLRSSKWRGLKTPTPLVEVTETLFLHMGVWAIHFPDWGWKPCRVSDFVLKNPLISWQQFQHGKLPTNPMSYQILTTSITS